MKTTSNLKKCWVMVALFFGSGCAALTIDVDVYKGPMTNHQEVQISQVSGMVKGAKPLLEKLKDRLEERRRADEDCKNDKIASAYATQSHIMGIRRNLDQAKKDTNEAETNLSKLTEELTKTGSEVKARRKGLDDATNELNKALQVIAPLKSLVAQNETNYKNAKSKKQEAEAQSKLFSGKLSELQRSLDSAQSDHNSLNQRIKNYETEKEKLTSQVKDLENALGKANKNLENATQEFESIKKSTEKTIEDQVAQASRNLKFATDQYAIQKDTLDNANRTLSQIKATLDTEGLRLKTVEREITEKTKMLEGLKVSENLAVKASTSINIETAEQSLKNAQDQLTATERDLQITLLDLKKSQAVESSDDADLEHKKIIQAYSEAMSKRDSLKTTENTFHTEYETAIKNAFDKSGSYIPTTLADMESNGLFAYCYSNLNTIQNILSEYSNKKANTTDKETNDNPGKSTGEEKKGLEFLISEYEKTIATNPLTGCHNGNTNSCDGVDKKRNELLHALIPFSEKIRYLANYEGLLGSPKSTAIGHRKLKEDPELVSYVRVLQAVGNSIFYQIDEIVQNEKYRTGIIKKGPAEVRALTSAAPEYFKDVLDVLEMSIQGEIRRYETEAKKAKAEPKDPETTKPETKSEETKTTNVAADQNAKTSVAEKLIKYNVTLKTIKDNRAGILDFLATKNLQFKPAGVKQSVLDHLRSLTPSPATEVTEVIETQMSEMRYPLPSTFVNSPNSKEVMDQLIDTLKYEHILEIRRTGEDSEFARQLEAAIKSAYGHRADMVQIRPALAYLRTSFPSTALQGSANLNTKNMLQEGMFSNLPVLGDFWRLTKETFSDDAKLEKNRAEVNLEIDKQFWQNINRIRLAGGGNTNYVVMKDDVGNWVVKNYSADPGPIIKSAQNLALFGMSSQLKTNLLPTTPKTGGQEGATQPDTQQTDQTPMERQFDLFKKTYDDQTGKELKSFEADIGTLTQRIQDKWKTDATLAEILDDLNSTLETAKGHLNVSIPADTSPSKSDQIINIFRKVVNFSKTADAKIYTATIDKARKALKTKIKDASATPDQIQVAQKNLEEAEARYQTAKTLMLGEVKTDLDKHFNKRLQTVGQFEGAVVVTNEIISPPAEEKK